MKCECEEHLTRYNSQDDTSLVRPVLEQISPEKLLDTWEDIISYYSQLLLTYPKDKLPALAGIATLFSQHVGDAEYLAGIWKALLPSSLFWHTSPVEPRLPETAKEFKAPSWSWAATHTPLMITRGTFHEDFTILDIWCRVPGKNPFGEVTEGCLTATGLYMENPTFKPLHGFPPQDFNLIFHDPEIRFKFHPDDVYAFYDYDANGQVMPWTVVFIAESTGSVYGGPGCPLVLVLKTSDKVEGSYIRIGLGTSNDASYSKKEIWRRDKPMKVFRIV